MKKKVVSLLLSVSLLVGYGGSVTAYGVESEDSSQIQKTDESIDEPKTFESDQVVPDASVTSQSAKDTQESQVQTKESSQSVIPAKTEDSETATVTSESEATVETFSANVVQQATYNIQTAANAKVMLSITGGSKADKARLELNSQLYREQVQFEILPVEGTWYVIRNVRSGLVLDVQGGSKANGAVVQQYKRNNSDAQKWQFIDAGDGSYYIQSKLGTVLDCPAGSMAIGTKLQTYELNRSQAQKWRLSTSIDPVLKEVAEGTYQLTGFGTDKVLALNGLLNNQSEKMALYSSSYNKASEFKLTKTADNWYFIENVFSGKVLDIAGGSSDNNIQIQQYSKNGSDAQQFRFIDAGDGYAYIQSKLGTVLDRSGGSTNEGTKIQTYTLNYSAAQKWQVEAPRTPTLVNVQAGVRYFISSNVNQSLVVEVSGGSTANSANIQLWAENAVAQQKFKVEVAEPGWYRIVNEKSGKVMDVAGGSTADKANVQQYTWNNSDAQKFRFVDAGGGLCYIQSKLGSYLDIDNGQNKNGANVQMYHLNRSNAQKFKLDALNQANFIRTTKLNNTSARITVFNSSVDAASMKFPTWSQTNGQDDLKWLDGSKSYDGSWSVVVNSKDFRDGGTYITHVYVDGNKMLGSTSYTLAKKNQDDGTANRLAKPPFYYSQLDPRWSGLTYGIAKLGPSGCVPSSMAMILKGCYELNVSPIDTANRIYSYGGFNQRYYGASATDLFQGIKSYGRTINNLTSLNELNDYLAKGYPVVMFVDVGIGHAIVTHGYSNGKTTVYDPYGRQFYNGWVSTNQLWNKPSQDSIDWTQGRPYFVIK